MSVGKLHQRGLAMLRQIFVRALELQRANDGGHNLVHSLSSPSFPQSDTAIPRGTCCPFPIRAKHNMGYLPLMSSQSSQGFRPFLLRTRVLGAWFCSGMTCQSTLGDGSEEIPKV